MHECNRNMWRVTPGQQDGVEQCTICGKSQPPTAQQLACNHAGPPRWSGHKSSMVCPTCDLPVDHGDGLRKRMDNYQKP